jgi:hypothetical protein|tara:strand:+ start:490 stop:873 length:384 start_codon:yes stop_codon:yes gene_type:complete
MISKFKALINKALPKKFKEEKVECAIDEDIVECSEMDSPSYTGVPAPAYLEYDEWFDVPTYSEKQLDYMEHEYEVKRQDREENFSVEPDNIHELMYDMATESQSTTLYIDPPGGSENFQEGWQSGLK